MKTKTQFHKLKAWILTLAILMTFILSFTLTASAAESYALWVGGEQFTEQMLTIEDESGGTAVYDPDTNTLTLDNYTYSGPGYELSFYGFAIYCGYDTLKLNLVGDSIVTYTGDSSYSYGVYADDSITVSGTGRLTVVGGDTTYSHGIDALNITVASGTVTAIGGTSSDESGSSYGVLADESITVSDTGSLNAIGGRVSDNGISIGVYAQNNVTISGGSLTAIGGEITGSAESYGFTDSDITILGGEIVSQGAIRAFYAQPTIGADFTNAAVWYGESEDAANEAGAKDISELADNYNQKYIKVAEDAVAPVHSITVTTPEHGTVTADKLTASAGETVTLTITPDSGYALKLVTINGTMDETVIGKTEVSFTMPANDVVISAEFKKGIPVYFDNSESQWIYVLFYYNDGYDEGRHVGNEIYAFIIPENVVGQFTNYMTGMPQENYPEGFFSTEEITPIAGQTYYYVGYDIIVDDNISGGTITPKVTKESYGQTVTLTVTPDSGKTIKQVIVKDENQIEIPVTNTENIYSFTMPAGDVTVSAVFEEVTPDVTVYNLWIGGEQVTSEKLTVTDENGGTAAYDPESNTLTLNDMSITSGYTDGRERVIGIYADGDLTIELVGENNITMPDDNNKSYGIRVKGDLSISGSGSLNAIAGNVIAQDSTEHYSTGIYTGGYLNIYGATVYAKGGDIFSDGGSYSCGVSTGGGLEVDFGGGLTAEGGNANGSMAYSTGLEALGDEEYLNISIYEGNLIANGGDTEGVIVAESNGAYLEVAGFYVYENTANVELTSGNAKVTSVDESNRPYACSNGITVYEGDITIHGGTIDISGGTWEGINGDGWAVYVEGEEAEDGAVSGGNVLIEWENIEHSPSGYGFIGSKVTITSTDEEKGAIFAGTELEIGDKLIMCQPEGGKVAEIEEEDYAFNTILNSDDSIAKNVVIKPLIHSVKIEGTDYGMSVLVPDGMSINEAYKDMLEKAELTDFSEIINTEKDGYIFKGFYTEDEEKFDFNNSVADDMTITAKWKKKSFVGGGLATTTTTTKNEDGSTTTVTENKATGTKTEVTTNTDGSSVTVETERDGTVTTIEKDRYGNTTTTVEKTDGSTTTEEARKDGTKVTTETTADGETTAEVKADGKAEVTIPVPDTGKVQMVIVTDENGDNTYITEFESTDNGVVITTDGNATVSVVRGNTKEFVDVHHASHWAEKSVDFVYILGLMNGTSEQHFSPDDYLTRAMLVTILYRAEGEPEISSDKSFDDVESGSYYEKAVAWAKENGIVNGTSFTTFEPDSNITREQIAAIMYRYADFKGYDMQAGENTNILSYEDVHHVSEYAIGAMQYAVGSGIIKGKTEASLNPLDNATRAEAAAILERFIKAN